MIAVCFVVPLLFGLFPEAECASNRERLTSCGEGWLPFGDMCYITGGKKRAGRLNWEKAEEKCEEYGGHLASVHSQELSDFLLAFFVMDVKASAWIGLHDRVNESDYAWTDGTPVDYTNWEPNEPSGRSIEIQDCGYMVFVSHNHGGKAGNWDDMDCSNSMEFICQKKIVIPPSLKSLDELHCPDEPPVWTDLGGEFCYYFEVINRVTWSKANFMCMIRGGSLTTLHSQQELDILHKFVSNKPNSYWIGLYRHMQHLEEFVWVDGTPLNFTHWAPDEPNSQMEQCAELWAHNMKWNDVNCDEKRSFICSIRKIAPNRTTERHVLNPSCSGGISINSVLVVMLCVLILVVILGVVFYHFRPFDREQGQRRKTIRIRIPIPKRDQRVKYISTAEFVIKDDAHLI